MSLAAREPLLLGAPAPVLAGGGAALAVATAVAETVLGRAQVASWPVEAAALAVLVAAGVVVVVQASPFRAPFRARSHVAVLGLVLAAAVLDELAQIGRDVLIHDDWGLVVVPVFLLVLATLRPPREVLTGGLAAVAVVAATVLALSPFLAGPLPAPARVGIAVTQVLPPALAAAALARTTLRALVGRRAPAPETPDPTLSVQQEAVARLEAEAIPLLTAVAAAGAATAGQADRARAIMAELRAALVADLARGWLAEAGFAVDDPDGYGERMTAEQRTALRTTVASLPLADFERPGTASARGQDREAVLVLDLPVAARPRRTRVAPLVPLLRTAFGRADVRIDDERVVVEVGFSVAR
ncbi:hypothetical protein [Amnibacterium kyonggiense]|uniref:Uncharacterized protein n=1 Tax=Amnibacterium kyonggiense TaxID=595671 RepID=A0A4R7FPT3_9MICO|nr:hypothetical protein [Amnibacterium kyonggiense]TDS79765.1 hypothetical protein CLV52_0307 [Amnibacterium kyonggiense]